MANKSDLSRRLSGAGFLVVAIIMLLLGETVLNAWLRERPIAALLYWMSSFVLVFLAMMVALLDLWIVRRRLREEHRGLLTETLDKIAEEKKARSQPSSQAEDHAE